MGVSNYYGRLTNASGTLDLSTNSPDTSRFEMEVPSSTISTTSEKLNESLRGAQWFDVQRYSTITLRSVKVRRSSEDSAQVAADLSLHGVTKPVTLAVRFTGAGVNPATKKYTIGFEATGSLQRSDFGVATLIPLIGDRVDLTLVGVFER